MLFIPPDFFASAVSCVIGSFVILQEDRGPKFAGKCWVLSFQSLLCCAAGKGTLVLFFIKRYINIVFPLLVHVLYSPHFLLQIASLTLMKDSERLDLLKEIGGTRVYEERRRESLKIMQETGTLLSKFMLLEYQ